MSALFPETEVAEKLAGFRGEQSYYHGESFAAIVGYNGNGAIIHYRAMPEKCALIKNEGILLLDSGGQYSDGTTDITRTIALGNPTEEQKRNFSLVLKGHIDLAMVKFPIRNQRKSTGNFSTTIIVGSRLKLQPRDGPWCLVFF